MNTILDQYDKKEHLLLDLKSKSEVLISHLLKTNNINIHHLTARKKERKSLEQKLGRKQVYTSLADVTDIVGCRIITYFEDDVDKVADIIEKEFKIDPQNSTDKRKVEFDRFGYQSLHYVVSFNDDRTRLTEYKQFHNVKFEVQIRSILQHSWAEIEHDIGYKGKFSIPDVVKRRFSRISALLETANLEFVALRNELKIYEENISKEIIKNPSDVKLDKASLESFILNDPNLKIVDSAVASAMGLKLSFSSKVIENILTILDFSNIKTIQELQSFYQNKGNCIIEFSSYWRKEDENTDKGTGNGVEGISLYDLSYFLLGKTKTKGELKNFFDVYYNHFDINTEAIVNNVFESLGKLKKECLE